MDMITIQQDFIQRTKEEIQGARNAWVSVASANVAKFARAFSNLCGDLREISLAPASALFDSADLCSAMRDAALETRDVVDPRHYGDTRERMDQIRRQRTAGGLERDVILNPQTQREMIDYLYGTLMSNEALESLGIMHARLLSLVGEIPVGTHRVLVQNIIDSMGKFVEMAERLGTVSVAEEICSNPPDLHTVQACVNDLVRRILDSDDISSEKKAAVIQTMADLDSAYPFVGEYARFGNAAMELANATSKLAFVQVFSMEPINDALNELVDALACIDNRLYYPFIQRQHS
ncbi:MAG: hypothetical protein LBD33_00980 [Puniceicoccales bacterium]|jgi:hypothetical protein|nr:hypothetical protein [Puniceicoccales bacterium]